MIRGNCHQYCLPRAFPRDNDERERDSEVVGGTAVLLVEIPDCMDLMDLVFHTFCYTCVPMATRVI